MQATNIPTHARRIYISLQLSYAITNTNLAIDSK